MKISIIKLGGDVVSVVVNDEEIKEIISCYWTGKGSILIQQKETSDDKLIFIENEENKK
jgi:hypothetical protein